MAKVLYHVTMSLDGFIAGPGDDMSWLSDHLGEPEPDPIVGELLNEIGALLIGERTYRGGDGGDGGHGASTDAGRPYGGAWTGPMFVLTRQPDPPPAPGFTFLNEDLPTAVAIAKAAAGDGYVVVLGATTARRCLRAGLLDEVLTHIAPVLLGGGVRLFDDPGGARVRLELLRAWHTARTVNVWSRVGATAPSAG